MDDLSFYCCNLCELEKHPWFTVQSPDGQLVILPTNGAPTNGADSAEIMYPRVMTNIAIEHGNL